MPLDMGVVTEVILGVLADRGVQQFSSQERVLKILRKLGYKGQHIPPTFDDVYVHALVEYGVQRPERQLLAVFRAEIIRSAFYRAFEAQDRRYFDDAVMHYVQSEAGQSFTLDYNLQQEYTLFEAIFQTVALTARTVTDIRHEQQITALHMAVEQLVQRADALFNELQQRPSMGEQYELLLRLQEEVSQLRQTMTSTQPPVAAVFQDLQDVPVAIDSPQTFWKWVGLFLFATTIIGGSQFASDDGLDSASGAGNRFMHVRGGESPYDPDQERIAAIPPLSTHVDDPIASISFLPMPRFPTEDFDGGGPNLPVDPIGDGDEDGGDA